MTFTIVVALIAIAGWAAFFLVRADRNAETKRANSNGRVVKDREATIQTLEAQLRHACNERDEVKRKWNAVDEGNKLYITRNIEAQDMAKAARKREEAQRAEAARREARAAQKAKAATRPKPSRSTSRAYSSDTGFSTTYVDTSSSCDSGSSGGGCD